MIKLCVFDFDSTLIQEETIDELARAYGVYDKVSLITEKAMSEGLSFFESIQKRVKLLKGMDISLVNKVCSNLHPTCGAKELISFLKQHDVDSIVFSGGFYNATNYFKNILGYKESFANSLEIKNDSLTGNVFGQMLSSDAKGVMLSKIKNILNMQKEEVMCVDDGANDISMFNESGLKIAFCAKDILKNKADFCIDIKDMREIIKVIKNEI